jgi:glycosyltransferase involved in cell wall biosynthesis
MRFLFLTQFYLPETGAPQNRLADLVHRLAESSHQVTVLTALPNYPRGRVFDDYRGQFVMEEITENVRIIRTWLYTTTSKGFVPRMANYLSFAFVSLLIGIFKIGRQDFVFVESPPLFLGLSGWLLSRLKRAKFVMNVSDLWPDSAVALGILQNANLIRWATWLEEFLYRRADLITGQTQGIVESISKRCADKPISLMPNGVNAEALVPTSLSSDTRDRIRREYGLEGQFVVGYAGLHGLAQGLKTVLETSKLLTQHEDIIFVFFGDGPEKQRLCKIAMQERLDNVRFFAPEPPARMSEILCAMDVALVPLKRHRLFEGALPSKLFEALGTGTPVIVSIEGEARALVEESRGGLCVEPENPQAMAEAIQRLHEDPALRRSLGENGRAYVLRHYNRKDTADRFKQFILNMRPVPDKAG